MFSKTHTKYIHSLHHKKFRDQYGVFIAEGPKVVLDLLESGKFICRELFALDKWLNEHKAFIETYASIAITPVQDFELEKISALSTPNNVLAVFEKQKENAIGNIKGKITLVLDSIQDPGNMGTVIRIADWFGIDNIICSPACADQYNPKVVQSTMGSLGRVNILCTDLVEWLQKNNNIAIYAASLEGKPVQQLKKINEGVIVIGNESKGISEDVLQLVNEKITIPKTGKAESLNAAVAAGILLSHVC